MDFIEKCHVCLGTTVLKNKCSACEGAGNVRKKAGSKIHTCLDCRGIGELQRTCYECKGIGYILTQEAEILRKISTIKKNIMRCKRGQNESKRIN
jgi:DnaJ-class molecular chaperone